MDATLTADNLTCQNCDRLTEADHRIANHLAMLAGYARLKSAAMVSEGRNMTAADALLLLNAVHVQIDAVADLHRTLSRHGPRAPIDLPTALGSVCDTLHAVAGDGVVIVRDFHPGCAVSSDDLLPVTQIVTELMTNAIKHGRDAAGLVRLSVSCKPIGDGKIEIAAQDNGPGLPKHAAPQVGHGLGFRIVERLLAQVDGQIAYHRTQDGLTVCLTVPSAG